MYIRTIVAGKISISHTDRLDRKKYNFPRIIIYSTSIYFENYGSCVFSTKNRKSEITQPTDFADTARSLLSYNPNLTFGSAAHWSNAFLVKASTGIDSPSNASQLETFRSAKQKQIGKHLFREWLCRYLMHYITATMMGNMSTLFLKSTAVGIHFNFVEILGAIVICMLANSLKYNLYSYLWRLKKIFNMIWPFKIILTQIHLRGAGFKSYW